MTDTPTTTVDSRLADEIKLREQAQAQIEKITEQLTRKEARTRQILNTTNDAFLATNITGDIIEWNTTATDLFGYEMDEVFGKSMDLILRPGANEDGEQPENCLGVVLNAVGDEYRGEMSGIHRDGHTLPVEVSISTMVWNDSFFFNVFIHDISHKKQMQEHMARAQKLESIGQLAAGIAHEINTPTQYVRDNIEFLRDTFDKLADVLRDVNPLLAAVRTSTGFDSLVQQVEKNINEAQLDFILEEVPQAIDEAAIGVKRVAEIVSSMKHFAHPGVDTMTSIDLNKAIVSTVTVSRSEWRYVAQLTTELDPSLPKVTCLPGELNQVILNLIVNAAHAVSDRYESNADKGKIHITTTYDKTKVEIRVNDNGIGMSDEVQKRIFDPFFTTKSVGKGTGQGLSLAFGVITEKHNGTIDVESAVGQGSTFVIRLPQIQTDSDTVGYSSGK